MSLLSVELAEFVSAELLVLTLALSVPLCVVAEAPVPVGNTLYLNPGYTGRQRFDLPRSLAILKCDDQGITADFIEL